MEAITTFRAVTGELAIVDRKRARVCLVCGAGFRLETQQWETLPEIGCWVLQRNWKSEMNRNIGLAVERRMLGCRALLRADVLMV